MRKEFLILISLLVLTMFVVGCTGKEDGANTTTEDDGATGEQTDSEKPDANAGSGSDLSEILGNKNAKLKYTAEYELTVEGKTQKWIQIYDLPNFATIMRLPEGETRMIFKDSTAYSCNNMDEEWLCFKLATIDANANDKLESDVKEGTAKPVYVGTCSRAGLSGEKYTVTAEGVTSTVCYTKKGILLELETKDMKMYATQVSETVDAAIFTLPVEPQDFSNMLPPGGIPDFE